MTYLCKCGYTTESGRLAFLHRDGTDGHQLHIVEDRKLTGIERQELEQEIQILTRTK